MHKNRPCCAINAKTIEVKFNKSVDTAKAVITVKKGSVTSNISAKTWNSDKTEVTLELAGKLTAGDYNVTVTGVTEEALTGSVTVENEKVEKVEILSDKAVLNSSKTEVTVGYKIENQYGEDVTANYTVNPSAAGSSVNAGVTAVKGLATIPTNSATVKEGDSVVLTLVHVSSGKSASKTLTVSAASQVAEININGVYNKDSKILSETTNLSREAFYLLVEGKDQYGKEVNATALDSLLKNNTNPLIVGLASSFETVKINGVEKTALRLTGTPKAGATTVMLISPTTGKSASYSIVVAEAQRADKITFEVPGLAVAGESLFVPVTVLDKEGNAITDLDILNDATRGITINGSRSLTKNAKGVIGFSAGTPGEAGYVSLVGISSTAKSEIVNIQVKAAAKPTVVRGLTVGTSAVVLNDKTIDKTSLVVEDQYGRAMTTSTTPLILAADGNATTGYRIAVTDNATNTVIANNGAVNYVYESGNIELIKGTNGAEKVEFAIEEKKAGGSWTLIAGSSQEIEFRVTDGTEYASYEVEEIGTIFDEVGAGKTQNLAYSKNLVVYGVLDDGKKVELTYDKYTVTTPSYLGYNAGSSDTTIDGFDVNTTKTGSPGSEATPAENVVPYATNATELKTNVVITINATGKQLTKEVTVSKVAPKVVEFKMVAQGTNAPDSKEAYDKLAELTTVPASGNDFYTVKEANTVVDFVAIDSYGVISKVDTGAAATLNEFKLVGTPAVAYSATLANQNAYNLTIAGLEKDEIVTVTATVDGLSKSFKIAGRVDVAADLLAAKGKVSNSTFSELLANSVESDTAAIQLVKDKVITAINDTTVTPTIDVVSFDGPITDANGSLKFTVTYTKGGQSIKSVQYEQLITKK